MLKRANPGHQRPSPSTLLRFGGSFASPFLLLQDAAPLSGIVEGHGDLTASEAAVLEAAVARATAALKRYV